MNPIVVMRDDARRQWLYFGAPVEVVSANAGAHLLPALRRVQEGVQAGLYAAGFLAYEAAPAFDAALRVRPSRPETPLLWFGLFPPPVHAVDRLPAAMPGAYALGPWRPTVPAHVYEQIIHRIKDAIARGETYQVNYTFRLRAAFEGDPWALFLALQRAQQAPFGAFIQTGDFAICSASPELFFRLEGDALTSRPMKGTAQRGPNLTADEANMRWLQASEKNRAENVMIVDMIRNDMGRVAATGSVHVPSLFQVERYPTLLQMTSTVQARTAAPLTDILAALFPCASITGAPKVRTMQIIAGLETDPRGVYTGAIGFAAPPGPGATRRAQFNVAIRTVWVDRRQGQAEYGVGSGIVWDSQGVDEYEECQVKARVLTQPPPDFSLLESLLWTPTEGYFLLERHLQRLAAAARYFVLPVDVDAARQELASLAATLPAQPHKVRLLAGQDGAVACQAEPITAQPRPIRLGLALTPVSTEDPFLYHKTTRRQVYDRALAERPDCGDVLLWNQRGEITESTRANVVLRLHGAWLTPPVASGLLAGAFRAELLHRGEISEATLTCEDLDQAEQVCLINSVRRWMDTVWMG